MQSQVFCLLIGSQDPFVPLWQLLPGKCPPVPGSDILPLHPHPHPPLNYNPVKKMWHIYTMEYYSAIKRNEIELLVVRWMDLESVIQNEVSQKEKNKYCMLTHKYGI